MGFEPKTFLIRYMYQADTLHVPVPLMFASFAFLAAQLIQSGSRYKDKIDQIWSRLLLNSA